MGLDALTDRAWKYLARGVTVTVLVLVKRLGLGLGVIKKSPNSVVVVTTRVQTGVP
jgi:hypothetical protein